MFLPWPVLVINTVLAVFRFLTLSAVCSALAIYSRFGDNYAASIRWSQQGGFIEMLQSIVNSFKTIPNPARIAMVLAILGSLVATLIDLGAASFIMLADGPSISNYTVVSSPQYTLKNWGKVTLFSGWSTSIRYGENIVDAMKMMTVDYAKIPNMTPGRTFTPRTSKYDVACGQPGVAIFNKDLEDLRLENNSCSNIFIRLGDAGADYFPLKVERLSAGRWSLAVSQAYSKNNPASVNDLELGVSQILQWNPYYEPWELRELNYWSPFTWDPYSENPPLTGGPPTTLSTKYALQDGRIVVLSLSTVRFAAESPYKFRMETVQAFDEQDELLVAIGASMSNPKNITNAAIWAELRVKDHSVDIVMCSPGNVTLDIPTSCVYSIADTFIVEKQDTNTLISNARGGRPIDPFSDTPTIAMTIQHIPDLINGVPARVSLSDLRNATASASDFMASLGQNFYTDYDNSMLYTLYDTSETTRGFDVPVWLIASVIAIAASCLALWISTWFLLDAQHTSSLYKVIAIQVAEKTDSTAPMLMKSKIKPLGFEGIPVVQDGEEHELEEDDSTSKNSLMGGIH
ncbi:hypothetical protein BGX26_012951 [Mortierella sp. AD094]|nr:hypothetical protein BGX26_012951 [Mortierella sp. AD094]